MRGTRPNIVLILADDMGFSDVGCFGGEIPTPNIDRLAAGGMRFTSFYNNAVCMPTRASLLTGLYPHQVGAAEEARLWDRGNITIAEVLKSAGYRTYMCGKWHNGHTPRELPVARGFDRYWGLLSGSSNYFNPGLKRPWEPEPAHKKPGDMRPWGEDDRIIHPFTPEDPDFYVTDAITEHALAFFNDAARDGQPFFLYVAYTAPHFPIQARPEDIEPNRGIYIRGWDTIRQERYERLVDKGLVPAVWDLSSRDRLAPPWDEVQEKEKWDLKMAVYAGMIQCMDRGIGRLLQRVQSLGKEEETLFIFLSDNGGCAEHINRTPNIPPGPVNSYCTVDAPWANVSNTPFRRFKVFHHEGGIATPMIAHWSGFIKPGGICHDVCHVMDFMPTFVELSGGRYPAEHKESKVLGMEGISLVPAFEGKRVGDREPLCWDFRGCRAVRWGDWKIVSEGPPRVHVNIPIEPGHEAWELYNMAEDGTETRDLAHKYPDKVKELESIWLDWRLRMHEEAAWAESNFGGRHGNIHE